MLMRKAASYQPELSASQLLALARAVRRTEPVSDIADLSEALKIRIARGGWTYPDRTSSPRCSRW